MYFKRIRHHLQIQREMGKTRDMNICEPCAIILVTYNEDLHQDNGC